MHETPASRFVDDVALLDWSTREPDPARALPRSLFGRDPHRVRNAVGKPERGGEADRMRDSPRETTESDVAALLDLVAELGAAIWLDGGWAVDACLGEQTRRHADLDIVVEERHTAVLIEALRSRGFGDVPRDDSRPWNFVLGDDAGREVDFHVIVLDAGGNGVYGPAANGDEFPAAALAGVGVVGGRAVRCISPEWLVRFHTGYAVDDDDWADVSALCARFEMPIPPDYTPWTSPPA
jgi:lincosamide nucleotidyltransferase A/C/D/E